ncbi:flippase [Methanosarcina sp.]|uniref:flippase n=1 Tax=Methanosarcina sp. TaxID=2213 RepID=UPI003C72273B
MFNLKSSKHTQNIQWSLLSLATSSLAHLLLRIVLGKELGPSGLGLYTLVFTIYLFGMQFGTFGISAALTNYVAEYYDNLPRLKELISSGILGSVLSGSILGLLLYLFSSVISIQLFHNPEMTNLLWVTALCFPFIAMQKAVIGALNGLREMKWYAVVNTAQNILVMIVSFALVRLLKMDVMGAVLGFVIPTITVGLLSLTFTRNFFILPSKTMKKVFKEISRFGFYIVLANSIGMVNTQIGSLVIGYFMNETEVGYYAVATLFLQGVTLLPQAVQAVTTPTIAAYYRKGDFHNIQNLVKNTMFKISAVILCISLLLAIFGKFLITFLFTEEFLPAYLPMLILLVGYFIHSVYASIGGCLSSVGKVHILFKIDMICAGLNLLLNVLLIPQFGLIGAASATSLSMTFTTLVKLSCTKLYTQEKQIKSINFFNAIK